MLLNISIKYQSLLIHNAKIIDATQKFPYDFYRYLEER